MAKVNREALLGRLEAVTPGLASRENVLQSTCFVFRAGRVHTFNEEVYCNAPVPLDVEGAVPAKPLVELLARLTEDELEVDVHEGKLRVKGKGRRAQILMEQVVQLPIEVVEQPGEWRPIPPAMLEGLSIVQAVAATKKDADFALTCVHIHPQWVEACDNFQVCRYPVATGMAEPCLVRQSSIRNVPGLGMSEMCEGRGWLHFRNEQGVVLSTRHNRDEYHDLSPILACGGTPIQLPGGLAEAVDRALVFAEDGDMYCQLAGGYMLLRGEGAAGRFEERRQVDFQGDIAFMIKPKILVAVSERASTCSVEPGRLKIESGGFTYVTCLGAVG